MKLLLLLNRLDGTRVWEDPHIILRIGGLCLGLTLMLGLSIVPALTMAADTRPIVGDWEGTLDPGAQPTRTLSECRLRGRGLPAGWPSARMFSHR